MKYLLAIIIVGVFFGIYILGYYLNSKNKINCDKSTCQGCGLHGCCYYHEEEEK